MEGDTWLEKGACYVPQIHNIQKEREMGQEIGGPTYQLAIFLNFDVFCCSPQGALLLKI